MRKIEGINFPIVRIKKANGDFTTTFGYFSTIMIRNHSPTYIQVPASDYYASENFSSHST